MICLPDTDLDAPVAATLADYQASINAISDYAERVFAAEREWKRRNTIRNPAFRRIRETLQTMCCGERRCGYCEVSAAAKDIDHFWPKSLYPENTFVWENYVFACGLCNQTKGDKFAVFTSPNGDFTRITRPLRGTSTPPPPGESVLIHPRFENPLDFFMLDLLDTFEFVPLYEKDENVELWRRASYTIEVLELNKRDGLPKARREAYESFVWRLHDYSRRRNAGAKPSELLKRVEAFQACNHQGVWQEMKRQAAQIDELQKLFDEVPDALTW